MLPHTTRNLSQGCSYHSPKATEWVMLPIINSVNSNIISPSPLYFSKGQLSWKTFTTTLALHRTSLDLISPWHTDIPHFVGLFGGSYKTTCNNSIRSLTSNLDLGLRAQILSSVSIFQMWDGLPGRQTLLFPGSLLSRDAAKGSFPTPIFYDFYWSYETWFRFVQIIQLTYHFCLSQPVNIINTYSFALMKKGNIENLNSLMSIWMS